MKKKIRNQNLFFCKFVFAFKYNFVFLFICNIFKQDHKERKEVAKMTWTITWSVEIYVNIKSQKCIFPFIFVMLAALASVVKQVIVMNPLQYR